MSDVLVLDMQNVPTHFTSVRRAYNLWLKDKATIEAEDETQMLRSECFEMNMPRVIKLKNFIARKTKRKVVMSRASFLIRDKKSCQYCGVRITTDNYSLDHVIPRARGGKTTWLNCVVACIPCNKHKADKLAGEVGMRLRSVPKEPSASDPRYNFKLNLQLKHPSWKQFAENGYLYWNVGLDSD